MRWRGSRIARTTTGADRRLRRVPRALLDATRSVVCRKTISSARPRSTACSHASAALRHRHRRLQLSERRRRSPTACHSGLSGTASTTIRSTPAWSSSRSRIEVMRVADRFSRQHLPHMRHARLRRLAVCEHTQRRPLCRIALSRSSKRPVRRGALASAARNAPQRAGGAGPRPSVVPAPIRRQTIRSPPA